MTCAPLLTLISQRKFSTPEECPGAIPDNVNNAQYIRELYFKVDPNYSGRFTVPVLWDKKLGTIGKFCWGRIKVQDSSSPSFFVCVVNNESSEIIRMFNTAFDSLLPEEKKKINYYPESLQKDIDELNSWVYDTVNNGVYKSGFATTQQACKDVKSCVAIILFFLTNNIDENNVYPLFDSLDRIEKILSESDYLVKNTFTEADIRLFTTIVRYVFIIMCTCPTLKGRLMRHLLQI